MKRREDADKVYVARQLNALVEEETNHVALLDAALEMLTDDDLKADVEAFRRDHDERANELKRLVKELGGVPFEPAGPTQAAEFEIGVLQSSEIDKDELLAHLEIAERRSTWLMDAVRGIGGLPVDVNTTLESALQREHQHHAWALAHVGPETQVGANQPPERPPY